MAKGRAARTAATALFAAALAWAGPAVAETTTLARGAMNLVGTPLDLALSPYTTTSTFVRKYYMKSDQSALTKIAMTPIMGLVYGITCTAVTGVTAATRFADGLVNVPVGIAALGMEKPPDTSFYEPVHGDNVAVVDAGPLYFGGYYCDGFFQ